MNDQALYTLLQDDVPSKVKWWLMLAILNDFPHQCQIHGSKYLWCQDCKLTTKLEQDTPGTICCLLTMKRCFENRVHSHFEVFCRVHRRYFSSIGKNQRGGGRSADGDVWVLHSRPTVECSSQILMQNWLVGVSWTQHSHLRHSVIMVCDRDQLLRKSSNWFYNF